MPRPAPAVGLVHRPVHASCSHRQRCRPARIAATASCCCLAAFHLAPNHAMPAPATSTKSSSDRRLYRKRRRLGLVVNISN